MPPAICGVLLLFGGTTVLGVLAAATIALLLPRSTHVEPLSEALRLEGVAFQLEDDSYDKVRAAFGPSRLQHNGGDAAGSLHFICYEGRDGTRLFVVGNEMAGSGANGFQLLSQTASFAETDFIEGRAHLKGAIACERSARLSSGQRLGAGLRLGMSESAVVNLLGVPLRTEGRRLIYEQLSPVAARPDGGRLPYGYTRSQFLAVTVSDGVVVAVSGFRITSN